MSKLRFPVKIKDGKMSLLDREVFDNAISKLQGQYYMELKETGVRSAQQNNYYWNIVDLLSEELGYTQREMHQVIKDHFKIQSTKTLTPKEFGMFIERLVRWCAIELSIVVPDPNNC